MGERPGIKGLSRWGMLGASLGALFPFLPEFARANPPAVPAPVPAPASNAFPSHDVSLRYGVFVGASASTLELSPAEQDLPLPAGAENRNSLSGTLGNAGAWETRVQTHLDIPLQVGRGLSLGLGMGMMGAGGLLPGFSRENSPEFSVYFWSVNGEVGMVRHIQSGISAEIALGYDHAWAGKLQFQYPSVTTFGKSSVTQVQDKLNSGRRVILLSRYLFELAPTFSLGFQVFGFLGKLHFSDRPESSSYSGGGVHGVVMVTL